MTVVVIINNVGNYYKSTEQPRLKFCSLAKRAYSSSSVIAVIMLFICVDVWMKCCYLGLCERTWHDM